MALPGLMAALALCLATLRALRGGLGTPRLVLPDLNAVMLGLLAVAAAVWFLGPLFGAALVLSVLLHEFGHVAAFRICGHADARFRLIPLIGDVAISNRPPATQEADFFIALMGPGICLAPMLLVRALLELDWPVASVTADFLWAFAMVTGAINFFNLMPFWPLDGGRCLAILFRSVLPRAALQATMAMAAATIVLAIYSRSLAMLFLALLGAQSLITGGDPGSALPPMPRRRAALAAGAYLATLACFALSGWPLLAHLF